MLTNIRVNTGFIMSISSLPSTLSLSRPLLSIAWERCVAAVQAAGARLRRSRRRVAERHAGWQAWQPVRHLSPRLLRDIGVEQFQPLIDAEHVQDEWKVRANQHGLG